MRRAKIVAASLLTVLALVFVAQNTEVVAVRFLAWELQMSRVILLGGSLLVGVLLGWLVAKRPRRRPPQEPPQL